MMTWILANWDRIFEAYGIIVSAGTFIVKCTKSKKDDTVWGKFVSFCDIIIFHFCEHSKYANN